MEPDGSASGSFFPDNVIVSTEYLGEVRKRADVEEEQIRFAIKVITPR